MPFEWPASGALQSHLFRLHEMNDTTASSAAFAAMVPTGIGPIDEEWGGLYRGGAYVVFGRAASGRGLLTLRFMQTGAQVRERSLFIASDRPKDLVTFSQRPSRNTHKFWPDEKCLFRVCERRSPMVCIKKYKVWVGRRPDVWLRGFSDTNA